MFIINFNGSAEELSLARIWNGIWSSGDVNQMTDVASFDRFSNRPVLRNECLWRCCSSSAHSNICSFCFYRFESNSKQISWEKIHTDTHTNIFRIRLEILRRHSIIEELLGDILSQQNIVMQRLSDCRVRIVC